MRGCDARGAMLTLAATVVLTLGVATAVTSADELDAEPGPTATSAPTAADPSASEAGAAQPKDDNGNHYGWDNGNVNGNGNAFGHTSSTYGPPPTDPRPTVPVCCQTTTTATP